MIIVNLTGGLGNQIFQWALGKSLSHDHDVFYQNHCNAKARDFALDSILNTKINFTNNEIVNEFAQKGYSVIQDDFNYKELNLDNTQNYILSGYWQSEKYFYDIRDEIINSVKLPSSKFFDFRNSCSLHIRRGDYVPNQHVHTVQPKEYYYEALEILRPSGNIFVFSDDLPWCMNNLKLEKAIFMEGNSQFEDLGYMSLCWDNIIANSTYSWWGAYLNKRKNKNVIFPNKWFNDNTNPNDIGAKGWVGI